MRAVSIRVSSAEKGWSQLAAVFKKNRRYYLQEALGLGIFMLSACFFSAMLFSIKSDWYQSINSDWARNVLMGLLMGGTALIIFYSPFTAQSGSQINPAVTLTFLRLGKMCQWDALFYIIFQVTGGTLAVIVTRLLMGTILTAPPVNSAVTIPGRYGPVIALITELIIAFITMMTVLFTSNNKKLKNYTRVIAAFLVCCWVIFAGPLSGFGMNPARTFATALPSGIWTHCWIYLLAPFAGMLGAAEMYLWRQRTNSNKKLLVSSK